MDVETYRQILAHFDRLPQWPLQAAGEATHLQWRQQASGCNEHSADSGIEAEELQGGCRDLRPGRRRQCEGVAEEEGEEEDREERRDGMPAAFNQLLSHPPGRLRRSRTPQAQTSPDQGLSKRVLDRVASDVAMVLRNVEQDYETVEVLLRQDLAANKTRWYGVWSRDLWCFLRNNNPVCSLCFSHYLHPISRKNRMVAMGLQVVFLLFISAALTEARLCEACGFRACNVLIRHPKEDCLRHSGAAAAAAAPGPQQGDDTLAPWQSPAEQDSAALPMTDLGLPGDEKTLAGLNPDQQKKVWELKTAPDLDFCCTCARALVLGFYESFPGAVGGALYAVLANCAFALTVFALLGCACCQRATPRRRKMGEVCGYAIVAALACVMLLGAPFIMRYVWHNGLWGQFTVNLVIGKAGSWCCVTLVNVSFFSCLWQYEGGPAQPEGPGCRAREHRAHHVTAEDYAAYVAALQAAEPNDPAGRPPCD